MSKEEDKNKKKGKEKEDNKKNKVDVDKIDLEKSKENTTENPGTIAFPHNVGSAVVKPEDQGKIKGRALSAMKEQTDKQMSQLYQQMQTLAQQAYDIKERVEVSERIYQAELGFEPLISHTYYLYEKKDGTDIVSMIPPDQWGRSFPYKAFIAAAKLLSDHTWELLDDYDDYKSPPPPEEE